MLEIMYSRRQKNYLDEDFQNMLFPLNLFQFVVFQQRYKIHNGFITPNSVRAEVKSLCGVILMVSLYIYTQLRIAFSVSNISMKFLGTIHGFNLVMCIIHCLVLLVTNITKKIDSVNLVLRIKEASEIMGCKQYRAFKNQNWLFVAVILFLHFCLVPVTWNMTNTFYVMTKISFLYFYANIVYAVRIIVFLVHLLKFWRKEIINCHLTGSIEQTHVLYRAFLCIHEAFNICKDIFRISVSITKDLCAWLYFNTTINNIYFYP